MFRAPPESTDRSIQNKTLTRVYANTVLAVALSLYLFIVLAAQALLASWPLPDGTLLVPRVLSNISDAPYLGESATLFAFTRRAVVPLQEDSQAGPPAIVYLGIAILLVLGSYEIVAAVRKLRRWRRDDPRRYVPLPQVQAVAWATLLAGSVLAWLAFGAMIALVPLLAALILLWQRKRPADDTALPDQ